MPNRFHRLLAALLTLFALTLPVRATALDDPDLEYYTLETPHFYVHYYSGLEDFAHRVAKVHEEAHIILSPLLDWTPADKTHVVITDKTDTANGSANVYGRNRVVIYSMPPEPEGVLGYYDDWLRILVYHEYVHILHLDTTTEEAPIINSVIGKQLNPNQVLPRWYIEGLATMYESHRTGTGRIESSLFQMWLRTAALEEKFFTLGTATGSPVEWPMGSAAYLYGGFFMDYVTETRGQEFVRKFNHEYGSRLIPFSLNQTAEKAGGETFHELWREWTAHEQADALAKRIAVRAKGQTQLDFVTSGGGGNRYPTPRPDSGQMSFHRADLESHAAFSVTRTTGTDHDVLFEVNGASGPHDWTPDGESLVYGRRTIIENVYAFSDLYVRNLDTGRDRRLTEGERAREPAVSPDGERIAYVRNTHGSMELAVRPLASGPGKKSEVLVGSSKWPGDDERHWQQISQPTWRPDGKALVFSWWRLDTRQRDLWLYEFDKPAGERLTNLTDDAAHDLDPHFADDGKLYFASDRTGIYNAYVMDLDAQKTWQLSNVVNGVFSPRPSNDGQWIYVSAYTSDGYEIARFRKPTRLWREAPESYAGPARRDYPHVDTSDWVTHDYQPWRWLAPLFFTPELSVLFSGTGVGGTLQGYDPISHHGWALSALWTTGPNLTDSSSLLSGSYAYGALPVDLGVSASVRTFPDTRSLVAENRYIPFTERAYSLSGRASYPIRSVDDSLRLSTSVGVRFNEFLDEPQVDHDPADIEPRYPDHGFSGDLRLSLSYSDLEYYPQGVSVTDGWHTHISFNLQNDLSDTDINSVSLTYGLGAYVSIPWFDHHVAAIKMNGGIIRSNFPGSRGFAIGGYSPQDILTDLVLQQPSGQFALRGYPPGFTRGSQYQVWSGEYRFPIHNFDQGFSTVPVFFRRLKGQLFADVGAAYDGYLTDADLLSSVGGEVQLDATFGYFLGGALRLGYAHGLDEGGVSEWYLRYGGGF
ncbi:hypothetical protein FIV42_25540 [Persicimonas caeni]|uniref:Bacterial surface antigen (D15) domain-containing protein n=1 Tax=Persicimonas caeni TaxID=2292766 RepID=A0A4Y6Q0E7_PERCE|nr:PD40 domain-containing protein [Persicimonas caeni]QDG53983.1 hypothetical protein FIV42_25540 [Persicimonas caeni]QED35204.1 hypothetical protein FRD00_25535 [Persicimonas caeni]